MGLRIKDLLKGDVEKGRIPLRSGGCAAAVLGDESQEQNLVVSWARAHEKTTHGLSLLHSVPNGGFRNKREAARLQGEGALAGVPDLHLPVARRGFHGLYIEMKTAGGRVTKEQDRFLQAVANEEYLAVVAIGGDPAIYLLRWYLRMWKSAKEEITLISEVSRLTSEGDLRFYVKRGFKIEKTPE